MAETRTKIRMANVRKAFGEKVILDGFNLDVKTGESMVVIGGSGVGKSVMLKCLLGVLTPESGTITIDGDNVVGIGTAERDRINTKLGMLFQGAALFDSQSVWENVAFGLTARKVAREEARDGLLRTNNEYTVGTLQGGDGVIYKTPDEAVDGYAFSDVSLAVIGTPDDLVDRIRHLLELTGGFGTVVGFVHDWANRENTSRSWDMVARYVIPEVNSMLEDYRESHKYVNENRSVWDRAAEAVKSKITENPNAAAAAKEDEDAGRDYFDFNEQKEAQKLRTKS